MIFLDPDVANEDNNKQLKKLLNGTPFFNKINKSNGNIFYLPFKKNIESLFWEYLESLDSSDKFYYDSRIEEYAISSDIIKREGPDSDKYSDFEDTLTKRKKWFKDNQYICEVLFEYWSKENEQKIDDFYKNFYTAFQRIYNIK